MSSLPPLDPRSESVLRTLIETYLQEGEPVGSRLLSKRYPEQLSSATIRNVLSDLEEFDLLSQPHTSAGRVPTERAYRYYVDRWIHPAPPPDPRLGAQLAEALEGLREDPELWLRHASRVLSEVLQGICVAVPFHLAASRLVRLEFVPLDARRIVAIWIGAGGEVEHQVVDNPGGFPAEVLTELGHFATARFAGCTLAELRQRLLQALREGADAARELHERLASLTRGLAESQPHPEAELVVSGLGQLGSLPEFGDHGRFRELVAAFEEHERLARLLNAFAERAARDVQLLLGSENPFLGPIPLATAVRTVSLGRDTWATFALVGPLRVDYARLLGGLAWWSQEVALRRDDPGVPRV
jgi:heat-inducible transcriptional repressor